MSVTGYYYLHTNGDLIYKRELGGTAADIRDSDFARALWPCDPDNRETAWAVLIEARAAGANVARVEELAAKWGCNDADAGVYAERVGCVLDLDGASMVWMAKRLDFQDLAVSPAGFGETCLEAMAELAISLGYKPAKMWGSGFADLLRASAAAYISTPEAYRAWRLQQHCPRCTGAVPECPECRGVSAPPEGGAR